MTVEHPNTRVVGYESDDEVSLRWNDKGIPSSRGAREGSVVGWIVGNPVSIFIVKEVFAVSWEAIDELESVSMHVKRMRACVVIVEDDFHNLIVSEDKGIGVFTIDRGACGQFSRG